VLYHYDKRDYQEAASDAADRARTKLEALIKRGQTRATDVINKVMSEVPVDQVAKGTALKFFDAHDDGYPVGVLVGDDGYMLHSHSLNQATERAGIPRTYAKRLLAGEEWRRELLVHNLQESYSHYDGRVLVRSVDSEVRGFLSDRFRRLDSRPIIEAFAGACKTVGAVPVEGHYMQTKIALKALIPTVYEPVDNEVTAIGLVLQNSDYGHGALSLRVFMLRLWCTNYAIADESLRQVHLGKRLGDEIQFSEKTYQLDTATMVSAVSDIVSSALSHESRSRVLNAIKVAHEQEISPLEIKSFLKKHFAGEDQRMITETFNSPDVVNLPPGQNRLRLSNAISWIAGKQDNEVKMLDMQQTAGKLLAVA
jgi:hypothetical protein